MGNMRSNELLGGESIAIGAAATYSTPLTPGLYDVYADASACFVTLGSGVSFTVDSTKNYLPSGGARIVRVHPLRADGSGDNRIGCIRSGAGSGTLYLNKHGL